MIVFVGSLILQAGLRQATHAQVLTPGISVSAPAVLKPITGSRTLDGLIDVNYWGYQGNNYSLIASVGDFIDPNTTFSEIVSTTVHGLGETRGGANSKITGLRNVLVNGWPGVTVTEKFEDGISETMCCFKVGSRFVELLGSYAGDTRPATVSNFLNSLQLDRKGPAISAEPELKRFALGDSGMTALFPKPPITGSAPMGDGDAPMRTFSSDYALRDFSIAYADMPANDPSDEGSLKPVREQLVNASLKGLHGTVEKEAELKIGNDVALVPTSGATPISVEAS